jgi:hypothetical protein
VKLLTISRTLLASSGEKLEILSGLSGQMVVMVGYGYSISIAHFPTECSNDAG